MAFPIKYTEGKKLLMLKRSAVEIYDARRRYEQKRTRKFQTSWMIAAENLQIRA